MLRSFQVAWRHPSTATYAWFLGPQASTLRLTIGAQGLQSLASRVRYQTQGHTNHPLWRPTLARLGRIGFLVALISWLCAFGAVLVAVYGELRRFSLSSALFCNQNLPLISQKVPAVASAPARSYTVPATYPSHSTNISLIFSVVGVSPTCGSVRWAEAGRTLTPSLDLGARGVWGLSLGGQLTPVRLSSLGTECRGESFGGFGLFCQERARVARLLVAAWKRHLSSARAQDLQVNTKGVSRVRLMETTASTWYVRSVIRRHSPEMSVCLRLETQSPFTLAELSAHPAHTLRYVQAPLAWAPMRLGC